MDSRAPRVIDRSTREARLRALLKSGFGPGLPRREADRFILLNRLAGLFDPMEPLAEKPLTERLIAWLAGEGVALETDAVTLRRALVDDGFLERDGRGLAYRRSRAHEMRVVFVEGERNPSAAASAGPIGLAGARCTPCHAGSPALADEEAQELLADLPDWTIERIAGVPRLSRAYVFGDFAGGLAFAVRLGAEAEAEGHHPELTIEWGRVTVSWWTHAIGGLHRNDFLMAARTDRLFASPTDA